MAKKSSSADDPAQAQELLAQITSLIGDVVIKWAHLDNELIYLLAKLAECPTWSAGVIYYALNSFQTQLGVIRGLAKHNMDDEALQSEIVALLDRLRALQATRNEFVHSVYEIVHSPEQRRQWRVVKQTFRSERSNVITESVAQVGEIRDHLANILDTKESLVRVHAKLDGRKDFPSRRRQGAPDQ